MQLKPAHTHTHRHSLFALFVRARERGVNGRDKQIETNDGAAVKKEKEKRFLCLSRTMQIAVNTLNFRRAGRSRARVVYIYYTE